MAHCPNCVPGMDRRGFLRFSLGTGATLTASSIPYLAAQAQDRKTLAGKRARDKKGSGERHKSVIVCWMGGGPSHMDTFDPKSGNANAGSFKPIDTTGENMQISELLPKLAKQGKHLSIIRSVDTGEGSHERGTSAMHLGTTPIPGLNIPPLGTVISYEKGDPDFPLPHYIAMSPPRIPQGNAFGNEYLPFRLNNVRDPIPNIRRQGVTPSRDKARAALLKEQNEDWASNRKEALVTKVKKAFAKSEDVMNTPLLKAFNIGEEPGALRSEYGGRFGTNLLLARRLVEVGVSFVEIGMGGWDNHNNVAGSMRSKLPQIDAGMGTLIKDLAEKDLLKDTIVMWMGEFGRTPRINGNQGRDHWARGFSVVMAGGRLAGGRVYGSTGPDGYGIQKRVKLEQLFATYYAAADIDSNSKYDAGGRKIKYSYSKPVKDLF